MRAEVGCSLPGGGGICMLFNTPAPRGLEIGILMYAFFIRQPVVAVSLALMMVLGGLFAAWQLPVAQYPDIVPPQVSITASFPGADCQTVADSVAAPIEQMVSGVEGMEYMSSTSTNAGQMTLNILFESGSSGDMDQVLSYLRYAQANAQLPTEVQQMGVSMRVMSGPPMLLYVLRAPGGEFDRTWMSNYAYINLLNPLLRTPGVGNVTIFGAGQYAMRIWLQPEKLAALGISTEEVAAAIRAQNSVHPMGQIGAAPAPAGQASTYTVRAPGRLSTPEEFGQIILRAEKGRLVRLQEVARIELGTQSYNLSASYNGEACAIIAVYQSPGSNALATAQAVEKTLRSYRLPPGLQLECALDTTRSVRLGIREILSTLLLALVLVMLVVFLFLQDARATLIPLAAIPVSLLGTFLFLPLFGMEINTICLMGLVLAIGLVVDDAIVVVEAVQVHLEAGEPPAAATLAAMREVAGPVVATALVLAAVFFPCLLLPGITGVLFKQFAVTIGVSILLSAFNALSLSPALAALLLRPHRAPGWMARHWQTGMYGLRRGYVWASGQMIRCSVPVLVALLSLAGALYPLAQRLPEGFLPMEDEGYFYGSLQMPMGSSLESSEHASEGILAELLHTPGVEGVVMVNGFNLLTGVQSTANAFFFVSLKPWAERENPAEHAVAIAQALRGRLAQLDTGGVAFAVCPPPIPGVGASGDITLMLEDRAGKGSRYLAAQTEDFVKTLSRLPQVASVQNLMAADTPQLLLVPHTEKALTQGVQLPALYDTLQTYLGSSFVNYMNRFGYQYQVYLQADAPYRMTQENLRQLYLPGASGSRIPLESLVQILPTWGPEFILRQNMYNASMLEVAAAPGYSAAQAMAALEAAFERTMPDDMGYSYSGMSFQEQKAAAGLGLGVLLLLSGAFAYLLLASLYGSWSRPLSVALTIPIAVLGAFLGLLAGHMQLDLYARIGLIMLIGLAAKNAILIVEFAQNRREAGFSLLHATLRAAGVRLRPILMTSLAFILGCIPLAAASGAGAAARRVVGFCVIGGMGLATLLGTLFIPWGYFILSRIPEQLCRRSPAKNGAAPPLP